MVRFASMLANGLGPKGIADETGMSLQYVKNCLSKMYALMQLNDPRLLPRVKVAEYMTCELFQIGLRELGLAA